MHSPPWRLTSHKPTPKPAPVRRIFCRSYPVALDAQRLDLSGLLASDILPSMTPEAMSTKGAVLADPALRHAGLLALIELPNGRFAPAQYVVGTDNFYAITRYNWSSFYAMSVIELGQAVQSSMPIH